MNKAAWALVALGMFGGVACQSAPQQYAAYQVADSAVPVSLSVSGMT